MVIPLDCTRVCNLPWRTAFITLQGQGQRLKGQTLVPIDIAYSVLYEHSDLTNKTQCRDKMSHMTSLKYHFPYLLKNSADLEQLASSEANWSGPTLFAKAGRIQVQQD